MPISLLAAAAGVAEAATGVAEQVAADGVILPIFGIYVPTIVFTLFNTGVIMLLYARFLNKPVMKILEERKKAIGEEITAAEEAKAKAEAVEKEYKALLADSKAEADRIISSAVAKAQAREDEIVREAEKNAVLIREKANEDVERERKRAVNEIKNQIAGLVIMAASKVAEKEISVSDNAALIDSFLVKAGVE